MITVDSTMADNQKHTLGTGTNDLWNDTRAHINLYSGKVEGAFLEIPLILVPLLPTLVVLIVTINPVLRMKLLSNCDTMESVDDESYSNCGTCLVEDEFVRLVGKNYTFGCY